MLGLYEFAAAAAGQRLLLQAPAGAPAAEAAAPAPGAADNTTGPGYQVSFGSSSCANATGPICYNTAISGENIITGMWVNLILGLICYLGFVLFRGMCGFEFYHARLLLPAVSRKPPRLQLHGHQRLWGWLLPVFKVSDEELVRSAGLDALIAVRIISFGVMLFLPMTILSVAVLIPVNYTSDHYIYSAELDQMMDEYSSTFMRMTISNIRQRSPLLWIHFVFCYLNVFWASWLIIEYYKEYIALRQTYLVRCTEMPGDARAGSGGSATATPLLTPSMGPSRSPLKRGLAVAHSPIKRSGGGGHGGSGGGGQLKSSSSGSLVGKAINRLKLPRRNASRAGDEFGEFNFRPSRFATPNSSPPNGSPMQHDVAAAGSIFQFPGPSRFSHSRNPSKGSPPPGAAAGAGAGGASFGATANGGGGGRGGAAQGLAAALAALPAGSPLHDGSGRHGTPAGGGQLLCASSGIELADVAAFSAAAFGSGGAGGAAQESSEAEPSRCSTPGSEAGGSGRVRRPLLYEQQMSSSDRRPLGSQQRRQRQAELYSGGSGGGRDDSISLRAMYATGSGAAAVRPPPHVDEPPRLPREPQQQEKQRQFVADLDRSISLSFGRPGALAALAAGSSQSGSLSNDGGGDGDAQIADTASSPAPQSAAAASQAPEGNPPASLEASGGSAATLLPPLAHQPGGSSSCPTGGGSGGGSGGSEATLPVRPRHMPTSSFEVASALGYDQAPPKPEEIYAAIVNRSAAAAMRSAGDGLPAAYGSSSSNGEPAASALEGGGDGISARWWETQQGDTVPRLPAHLSLTHSITFKGSVRLARPGDTRTMAANASLFTCLVMDMPLEKLKLRRLGVFTTIWRAFQSPPGSSSGGGGGTPSLGRSSSRMTTAASAKQEDINAALEDLERGQAQECREDAAANATGLSSLFARLCGLRRHHSRYSEWRRDVRWAMYNKRVRIATEMFSELFGSDFDSIIPIYPTESVDKLAHRWDAKVAVLERLQYALNETPRHKAKQATKLKQRILVLQKEVADLQNDIAAERDAVLSDLPSTCFFATFKSQQAAAIASQTNLNPIMQRLFKVQPAPRPDDVNWPALQRSWWQRTMRPIYALPIILFFMLLPIGMFTGAFAQLTIALCGNPNDTSHSGSLADSWYCSDDRSASFLRNTITSLAPSLILSIYHMVFLPVMVYYAAQMEGQHVSLSALDRRCAHFFFYWDVFNIFLGALFGGTVLAELKTFLDNPSHIWSALGSAIPASSNFFINYVLYRALVMSAFRLFYPHQAIMASIMKWLRIVPKAKTQRDKLLECPPRNCRYGRDIGIPVLMNFVMVLSMCVTSPLILPIGLLYFVGLWSVWRYQMLYVYQRQYESGGQFWPLVAHKVVGCLFIMVIFTACVLLFKGGYTQAAILFITLPIFLLRFDNYLTKRYDDLVKQVPLMAVHSAGRSTVPSDIYTPPPLRTGGQGWHPEWGKVWQHWGIGRYTI